MYSLVFSRSYTSCGTKSVHFHSIKLVDVRGYPTDRCIFDGVREFIEISQHRFVSLPLSYIKD